MGQFKGASNPKSVARRLTYYPTVQSLVWNLMELCDAEDISDTIKPFLRFVSDFSYTQDVGFSGH